MNEQKFLEFFENLFDGLNEEIDMNTEFRYIDEWSSLTGLAFMTDMAEKYGKSFTISEVKEAETIRDLYNIYQSK
ncbi:acyl carrier protein [Bacteroides sp.]|uniref:acyl carrier protein n=1 Tax=Bacteroides sp. TaxID=29523 RepID=UPI0025C62794|nr:acyl carrier protein [Bacteroides sp.]